jgi:hypothetical protein
MLRAVRIFALSVAFVVGLSGTSHAEVGASQVNFLTPPFLRPSPKLSLSPLKFSIDQMVASSYLSSGDAGFLSMNYEASLNFAFSPEWKARVFVGYDLLDRQNVTSLKLGNSLSLSNLRGASVEYTGKNNFHLILQYGENRIGESLDQNFGRFSPFSSFRYGSSLSGVNSADSLSLGFSQSFFNQALNVSASVSVPHTGLR